jgi:hypothetical protein
VFIAYRNYWVVSTVIYLLHPGQRAGGRVIEVESRLPWRKAFETIGEIEKYMEKTRRKR